MPVLMKCPQEKALPYTAVVIVCGFIAGLVLGWASHMFGGPGRAWRHVATLAAANPIVRITIQLLATVVVKTGVPGFLVVSELGHELERDAVARPETAPEHEARHAVYARLRDAASPDHADRGSFAP